MLTLQDLREKVQQNLSSYRFRRPQSRQTSGIRPGSIMRVLFDQATPVPIRQFLGTHIVKQQDWDLVCKSRAAPSESSRTSSARATAKPLHKGSFMQRRKSCFKPGLPYLGRLEVHFTPEQEAQLAQLATKTGTDAGHLVQGAVLRLLEGHPGFPAFPHGSVVAEMRTLRARARPNPEGWTTRDYVHYGRR
jgi:hypothetical protein